MERNQLEGRWEQVKGEFRRQFGKLTDADVEEARGNYDKLLGKIQVRYGEAKEAAAERLNRFLDRISTERRPTQPPGPAPTA